MLAWQCAWRCAGRGARQCAGGVPGGAQAVCWWCTGGMVASVLGALLVDVLAMCSALPLAMCLQFASWCPGGAQAVC